MRKPFILIFVAFWGIIFSSCEKIDELLTFTFTDEATINIPSSTPISLPFEIKTPDVTTNSSTAFENNNTNADHVKDVKLKSLDLTIKSPSDQTFSFLKSITIYISAEGLPEKQLASQDNISSSAQTIALTTSTESLDDYIKSSSYELRTKATLRETLTRDISIKAEMEFQVTAKPL